MDHDKDDTPRSFTSAELGFLAHVYRGELYRSTLWRTRLDTTTNWSVVTLGIALSISFSSPQASPIPLLLVGVLIVLFLMLEARRYRYFNVWRARARWMEKHIVAPMLADGNLHLERGWQQTLAHDYRQPSYHVSVRVAVGRRIRRNYLWILLIQTIAYLGKLLVHPAPLRSFGQLLDRAAIGPIPGWLVLLLGAVYCLCWGGFALWSRTTDRQRARLRGDSSGMG
ncbi:MAG: DUF2270 domain-containing protein [Paracoccus sp. (in: a-proteobacteria)]|uniref:DUF2270 domain-containing protein n=1 Tax=Paracoccus sp. TaxID=267 RepID=UPI0026E03209|nr:DUF2270 domain-containing protein [Paracoccus sp. (in: a-proteobacteria)]MDO5613645.1 DUF2270 domain-containing protein [Paracoccus sp. (in: a-proteobacteria)]